MNLPVLDSNLPTLLTECIIVGHAKKADVIWTKAEFLALCAHMLNENPQDCFMLPYRDEDGTARYAKARKARAGRRANWAWDTITGRSKSRRVSIGFYPTNEARLSRWAAMDFDAHDGEEGRARALALAAFGVLMKQAHLYIVLCTSGSTGWHLFVFTREFHHIEEWTRMLKQVASVVGANIRQGECEIFPRETQGKWGYAIRAPGVWNPKYDTFSEIQFQNVSPLLARLRSPEGKENSNLFTSRSNVSVDSKDLTYGKALDFYRGARDEWQKQFCITASRTRHLRLRELVGHVYRQASREVGRANARMQYQEAVLGPQTSLTDHLKEFDDLWQGMEEDWQRGLSNEERQAFDSLNLPNDREAFRIIRNFAQFSTEEDFYINAESLGKRLLVTMQTASNIRKRFCKSGILEHTAAYVRHKLSARYRWLSGGPFG